jgi:hypothetical protein
MRALVLASLFVITACSSGPVEPPFDARVAESIHVGLTTKAGVLASLGPPPQRDVVGNSETWTYYFAESQARPAGQAGVPLVGPGGLGPSMAQSVSGAVWITFSGDIVAACRMSRSETNTTFGAGLSMVPSSGTTDCGAAR